MQKKIILLLMEKNQAFLKLKQDLEHSGYEVIAIHNGRDGFEAARRHKPDLILADYYLTGLSGPDLTYMVRNSSKLAKIPIMLYADYLNREERINGFRSGADAVITSAISMREITVRIKNLITTYEAITRNKMNLNLSLSGKLSDFKLVEIIQLININLKSGILTVYHNFIDGQIVFDNGEITFALVQDLTGEQAVHEMVSWTSGAFVFEKDIIETEKNVTKPTMQLILDCCQLLDESTKQSDQ